MGRWLKKIADIRKSELNQVSSAQPSVSFVSAAVVDFQNLKGKSGINEAESFEVNQSPNSPFLPVISINDKIEQKNTNPEGFLTILEPCCIELGINVQHVVENLLSDKDKNDIANGYSSASAVRLRIEGWKKNGMPRYVDNIDTRKYCSQCANLSRNGQCLAAAQGKPAKTARIYHPVTNVLKNCDSYAPRTAAQGIWKEPETKAAWVDQFDHFLSEAYKAGIVLLTGDIEFLRSQGYEKIKNQLNQYIQTWLAGMNDEENECKKQNKGRNRANTFIHEYLNDELTKPTQVSC